MWMGGQDFAGVTKPLRPKGPELQSEDLCPSRQLLFCGSGGFVQTGGHDWVKERHHGAQLQADLLDLLLLLGFAACQEIRAALFVFFHPAFNETSVPDAAEKLLHLP